MRLKALSAGLSSLWLLSLFTHEDRQRLHCRLKAVDTNVVSWRGYLARGEMVVRDCVYARTRLRGMTGVTVHMRCPVVARTSLLLLVAILQCVHVLCCAGAEGAWAVHAAPHSRLLQLKLRGGGAAERQGRANAEKRTTRSSQPVTDKESRQGEKGVKAKAAQQESEAKEGQRRKKREPSDASTHTPTAREAHAGVPAELAKEKKGRNVTNKGAKGKAKGKGGELVQTDEEIAALKKKEKRKRDKLKKKQRIKENKIAKVPFRPWADTPANGETLMPDLSVYDCWFPLKVEWPALTFDILEDTKGKRKGFPLATAIVAGTQVLLMC